MDSLAQKSRPSTLRTLRGHKAAITTMHAVCKAECGEDSDDSGHFISGSADCTVISFPFPAYRENLKVKSLIISYGKK